MAEEDDEGGDAAEAVEVRGRVDPVFWFMVGEDYVGYEAGEEVPHESARPSFTGD